MKNPCGHNILLCPEHSICHQQMHHPHTNSHRSLGLTLGLIPPLLLLLFMPHRGVAAAAPEVSDAVLPAGTSLDWDKNSVTTVNPKRSEVSLNGLWRFIPAVEGSADAPKLGWGYIQVPGRWAGGGRGGPGGRGRSSSSASSSIVAPGGGPQWQPFDGSRVASAWYERQVTIPADWQGRLFSLRFDRVSTDAIVYVNGKECGKVPWPWGSVDITSAVTPGQTATVRVLVAAIADKQEVGHFWQNAFMDVSYSPARLATRGLTGNVTLESRASEGRVTDVWVRTSTRKKEVSLDVDLTGVTQAGQVRFLADMLNEKGEVEKSFTADTTVQAKNVQTVTVSWPWANPRLWDVGQPKLYTLRLTVHGAGVDDQYSQGFGFREFWAEGKQFYLNGTIIRFRQSTHSNGQHGQVGDNFSEFGSEGVDTRGDTSDNTAELNQADRQGYLAAEYVLNPNKYMVSRRDVIWEENKQEALDRAAVWMRHYRNHPSIIIWIAGLNLFNDATDNDPRHLGRGGWDQKADQRWQQLMKASVEMFDGMRKLDPTRLYYSHAGVYTGDFYTINSYMDMIPLQEREDWLSEWAKSAVMPLGMCEFGPPMDCSFRRAREGFEGNVTSEPLLTEYAAIYFGNDAYTSEEPKYRQYLHDLFRGGMLYDRSENQLDDYADQHKIQELFRVNTWRSWRTVGLPGGLRIWSWMQDALKDVNYPTLAWIAGPSGDYTAKDHHFTPGQKIEKQLVLINDSRQPQKFTAAWTATAGGKELAKDQIQGTLEISEIKFIPIQVTAPAAEAGGKADGQITLAATIGDVRHQDSFAFRVFGVDQAGGGQIAIVDPEGLTAKMLANLGYTTSSWNGGSAALVVIGRDAMERDATVAAKLESYVRDGGRALICAQAPQWMARATGWRLCPKVARRVFSVDSQVTGGLDAGDLRDWTGGSTLIEAYPEYVPGNYQRGNEGDQPYAGWHWGNRGGISSAPIEKPHRSGWRPLLECEFDLAYTPLMELDYGKGRLILCTLDLEDHVDVDPAARRMAGRVLDYALHSPLSPQLSKVVYVGGATGSAWLDKTGVRYQPSATLDTGAGLVLIGPDATVDTATLNAYLEKGGKAFFLPRSQADGCLDVTLRPAAANFAGSLSVPAWPETRGLSASDLRWRTFEDTPPWIVSVGAEIGADGLIGRKTIGKGVAVFCQIDPDALNADQKTYMRYTRWRSTRAVAQLLANLGASFPVDARVFHPLEVASDGCKGLLKYIPGGDETGRRLGPQPEVPMPKLEGVQTLGYYHPDYLTDFIMGDNPYRYYRW